ncbi:hypothetical protein MRB53_025204 [Persea americana]|nr:hypothetical protein MRB53_025204 [Persea americana]
MADQGLEGSQPVDLSKHPSGIVPTLQNIVSTVNLDCKLDLKAIALQARNAEYNPKVCTGAKSEAQSKLAARKSSGKANNENNGVCWSDGVLHDEMNRDDVMGNSEGIVLWDITRQWDMLCEIE